VHHPEQAGQRLGRADLAHGADDRVPNQGILQQGSQRGHGAPIPDLSQACTAAKRSQGSRSSTFTSASTASDDRICDRLSITCWATLTSW
jgi:hypothetical protein